MPRHDHHLLPIRVLELIMLATTNIPPPLSIQPNDDFRVLVSTAGKANSFIRKMLHNFRLNSSCLRK
jgi:hypothetical protein